ncbi:MAG: sugar phosphate nucleotidyltransferase, partial [Desulfatiglandales bacterium]|nr:sugar phosphate nucleotidyltransferase [Desulfatiglandales bacterium]
EALCLARHFTEGEKIIVMLGDNIIEGNIKDPVALFRKQEKGARILLKEVPNPESYGVAELKDGKVISIKEKPKNPKSNLAVIGIYLYDQAVFDVIDNLEPSARGELEITDVNINYLKRGELYCDILKGWWGDAGESFESFLQANNLVARTGANKIDL